MPSVPTQPCPRIARERGFTIIEVVVVCVLVTVVIGMLLSSTIDALHVSNQFTTGAQSSARVQVALEQIGTDIRYATSVDRATGGGVDPEDLTFVSGNRIPRDVPATRHTDWMNTYLDVVYATPTRLVLAVRQRGVPRCVDLERVSGTDIRGRTTYSLTRKVYDRCWPLPPAGRAPLTSSVLIPASTIAPPNPFMYALYDPAAPNCRTTTPALRSFALSPTNFALSTRIAEVRVDLRAFAQHGKMHGSTQLVGRFQVRGRSSVPYRTAIGGTCA